MSGDVPERRSGDYRTARIGAAAALTAALVVLLLVDALSDSYVVDSIVLGSLLAGILTLLGVDAIGGIVRRKP